MNHINCISNVKIKGLWNKFNLEWTLDPHINILSGINGSGKSTVLSCIANLLQVGQLHNQYHGLVREVCITFDNDKSIDFKLLKINDTIRNLEIKAKTDSVFKKIIEELQERHGNEYKKIKSTRLEMGITSFGKMKLEDLHKRLAIDAISTFDNEIPDAGRRPDEMVKTELDRDIFKLQKQYLDFQLNIGKKAFEMIRQNNESVQNAVLQIRKQQDRFLEIIDNLFSATDKRINRDKNEIMFLAGKDELTAYQLSSGEKQILVILLTVLVQDNKPIKNGLEKGKLAALEKQAGSHLLICVDSDYDYLLQNTTELSKKINEHSYIFQTYTYSIENLYCYSANLHSLCVQATQNDTKLIDLEEIMKFPEK